MTIDVELLGLPGSGKTTLVAAARDRLQGRVGIGSIESPTGSALRKTIFYAHYVLQNPLYALLSTRAILASGQRSTGDLGRVTTLWLKRCARVERRRAQPQPEVRLTDAGVLQALWSIAFSSKDSRLPPTRWRPIQTRMPVPDVVFVVEAQPSTITRRLADRPGQTSRLERQLEAGPQSLARAARALDSVLELVRPLAPERIAIEKLDNDLDDALERNAGQIVETVLRAARSGPAGARGGTRT